MRHLRSIWRAFKPAATAAACWLAVQGTALGQEEGQQEGGGWWASYGVVLLGIVLGILGVCMTSRRRERAKPQTYTKKRLLEDED